MLGDHDDAIDLLEQLLATPSNTSKALMRLEPQWQPLHGNPRWQQLTAQ